MAGVRDTMRAKARPRGRRGQTHIAREAEPMNQDSGQHRLILQRIADQAMTDAGLLPNFSPQVMAELSQMNAPAVAPDGMRDQTQLLWCSIDNDDSLDLDQLTVAEALPDGK